MTAPRPPAPDPVSALLHLEARARAVSDAAQLEFVIANETWQLAQYRQAVVWRSDAFGRPVTATVSGLAALEGDTPFTLWIERVGAELWPAQKARRVDASDLSADLEQGWAEWFPAHALYVPLRAPEGRLLGAAMYVRETAWDDRTLRMFEHLHAAYAYSAWALSRRDPWAGRFAKSMRARKAWVVAALLALSVLCVPVRISALAPAEVVALDAQVVAAPMDGVVKAFHVSPNQPVAKDDLLFTLDDTTLAARREVAAKALDTARADALLAAQKAFDNERSRADLAVLQGRVREKEAELASLAQLLGRVEVRAPRDGIVVFGDPNDWVGKPVVTGERIAQLADPKDAGVLVWLPAADAINLEPGAEIRLFLHVAPLAPLPARLVQTSYQAIASPEGVVGYRVRGTFTDTQPEARIGLKGTAKLYGERVPLAYLALRRPLATLREWSGW